MVNPYHLARPLVFKMDPELAHQLTVKALKTLPVPTCGTVKSEKLTQNIWGLDFLNPVGVAAGFDKNAEVVSSVFHLGFGFTEVGTVTPKTQNGNPKPRIFRDPKSQSVINRMGFPNKGALEFKENLEKFLHMKDRPKGIIGINIGMNKEQNDPAHDYCALIRSLGPIADFLVVNISSPNTPGLRDLQKKKTLQAFLKRLRDEQKSCCGKQNPPLLIKLAPDLDEPQQEEIADILLSENIDGIVLSNTTTSRPASLPQNFSQKIGGLSGAPLRAMSTQIIRNFYKLTRGKLPIIGIGGISNAEEAYEKIKAGASLVEVYTGLVYEGPMIASAINKGLLSLLERDGLSHISEAIGLDARSKG